MKAKGGSSKNVFMKAKQTIAPSMSEANALVMWMLIKLDLIRTVNTIGDLKAKAHEMWVLLDKFVGRDKPKV